MFRQTIRKINAAFTLIINLILFGYRYLISPVMGQNCRFYPSCSEYAQTAINVHGVWRGCWLASKRIMRCHPWHSGGYDPVPGKKCEESIVNLIIDKEQNLL
jgi:uncharacterized protein